MTLRTIRVNDYLLRNDVKLNFTQEQFEALIADILDLEILRTTYSYVYIDVDDSRFSAKNTGVSFTFQWRWHGGGGYLPGDDIIAPVLEFISENFASFTAYNQYPNLLEPEIKIVNTPDWTVTGQSLTTFSASTGYKPTQIDDKFVNLEDDGWLMVGAEVTGTSPNGGEYFFQKDTK